MLLSMALTSFLTGVTEPIEFSFMFLAPVLYGIHALLTGAAMTLMHLLGVKLGFGFSAGLFDYVLNFSLSTRPWLLVPVGIVYFGLYYGLFRWAIVRFDLKTPGREPEEAVAAVNVAPDDSPARAWIRALGGTGNLVAVDACTTRLRLNVADQHAVDEAQLKRLGARGVVRPGADTLQVVVGPIADQLAGEIRHAMAAGEEAVEPPRIDVAALIAALGGRDNIAAVAAHSTRLSLQLRDAAAVDADRIRSAGARAAAAVGESTWHVIVGPQADATAQALSGA
jgi:PTS system N-acetylglucosamine-specific IIC component